MKNEERWKQRRRQSLKINKEGKRSQRKTDGNGIDLEELRESEWPLFETNTGEIG
jgi:hypothetical protein